MEERAYLFATWVAPVVYLTARAYAPTEHVTVQLNMTHRVALDINTWHLTMPIIALPPGEGGLGQVGLGAYTTWVHSQSFVGSGDWGPHTHALKNCYFAAFTFDTVRKAFGLAPGEGGAVEPSRLLLDDVLL